MVFDWKSLIFLFGFFNLFLFAVSVWQSVFLKHPFGRCHLAILGCFVWGDAVVFSLFWLCLALVTLFFVPNVNFFLFCASVFFAVRGFGETVYWLLQQFSKINKNPPKSFSLEKVFAGESVWFGYQIIWQVVCVASIISAVFFADRWLA